MRVVQSKAIRPKTADRCRKREGITPFNAPGSPLVLGQEGRIGNIGHTLQVVFRFAAPVSCCRAGSAGVFPFGFGRQSELLCFFLAQPLAKLNGIIPTNIGDGVIVRLFKAWIFPIEFGEFFHGLGSNVVAKAGTTSTLASGLVLCR